MSFHALERLQSRYSSREFDWSDIRAIIKAIKQGECYYVDAANEDRIIVLILYENIPMKLVYSATQNHKGAIVTALPLDIDEWNSNISQIPPVYKKRNDNKNDKNKYRRNKEK